QRADGRHAEKTVRRQGLTRRRNLSGARASGGMNEKSGPETIEDVLECLEEAGNGDDDVAVSDIVHRIGDDAFAPLMLAPALIMLSPATAIFGVATLCGVLIALIAMQIVLGRKQLWLPRFVLDRRISAARRDRIVGFLT